MISMITAVFAAILFALPAYALQSAVSYDLVGVFEDVGGPAYRFRIVDAEGLKRMVLPGIYPNIDRAKGPKVSAEELYRKSKVWALPVEEAIKFWGTFDPKRGLDPRFTEGVRQFYYAQSLERAGRLHEAIYAYYAVVVHFPGELDPNRNWPLYWPAYLGERAMDAIYFLTSSHPELGLRYVGGDFTVNNGFNDTDSDDILRIWPGHLVMVKPEHVVFPPESLKNPMYTLGSTTGLGLVRFGNEHWQLMLNGRPFTVKGMRYHSQSWSDGNSNGKTDAWESWMDGNRNGVKDSGEPALGDFALMSMMGANTVMIESSLANPHVLREAYAKHGLYFILGDALLSEAARAWPPADQSSFYANGSERSRMILNVERLVRMHKDEPHVLAWYLGDGIDANIIRKDPRSYYDFLEIAAKRIHELDSSRPVIVVNNDLSYADLLASAVPSADIIGVNSYRGFEGFGKNFWKNWRDNVHKPVLITGYGAPAYGREVEAKAAEELQSLYHGNAWKDITSNLGGSSGVGNALGGVAFEWTDSWERAPVLPGFLSAEQQKIPEAHGPFIDGRHYSEWYGIMSLGNGAAAPFIRQPRKVFWQYLKIWKRKE